MNYADIRTSDLVNGEGTRISLWVTGCPFHCEGCHNSEIWEPTTGKPFTEETLDYLINLFKNAKIEKELSILGGEPLANYNYKDVLKVCKRYKKEFPNRTIWLWTGFNYEDVKDLEIMKYIDVLVDGQFYKSLKSDDLMWKGSANQQVIKLKGGIRQ